MDCRRRVAVLLVFGLGGVAHGDETRPTAALALEVVPGVTGCPDEEELRAAISARLGYDPFRPDAASSYRVRIRRTRGRHVAAIDASAGRRELTARTCPELGRALALTISVAIDPLVLSRPPPAPPAPEPPPTPAPLPEPEPPSPPPVVTEAPIVVAHTPRPWRGSGILAGAGITAGAVPGPRPSILVGGALRHDALGARVVLTLVTPATAEGPSGGELSVFRVTGALEGCAHLRALFTCAGAQLGLLRWRSSGLDVVDTGTTLVAGALVEGGARFSLSRRLGLEVHAGVELNLRRAELTLSHEPTFTTGRVAGHAGIRALVEIP